MMEWGAASNTKKEEAFIFFCLTLTIILLKTVGHGYCSDSWGFEWFGEDEEIEGGSRYGVVVKGKEIVLDIREKKT
jgi:hypothetical protein